VVGQDLPAGVRHDNTPGSDLQEHRSDRVSEGGLGHREVGAVPPAAVPVGEERRVRGFMDMVGT